MITNNIITATFCEKKKLRLKIVFIGTAEDPGLWTASFAMTTIHI